MPMHPNRESHSRPVFDCLIYLNLLGNNGNVDPDPNLPEVSDGVGTSEVHGIDLNSHNVQCRKQRLLVIGTAPGSTNQTIVPTSDKKAHLAEQSKESGQKQTAENEANDVKCIASKKASSQCGNHQPKRKSNPLNNNCSSAKQPTSSRNSCSQQQQHKPNSKAQRASIDPAANATPGQLNTKRRPRRSVNHLNFTQKSHEQPDYVGFQFQTDEEILNYVLQRNSARPAASVDQQSPKRSSRTRRRQRGAVTGTTITLVPGTVADEPESSSISNQSAEPMTEPTCNGVTAITECQADDVNTIDDLKLGELGSYCDSASNRPQEEGGERNEGFDALPCSGPAARDGRDAEELVSLPDLTAWSDGDNRSADDVTACCGGDEGTSVKQQPAADDVQGATNQPAPHSAKQRAAEQRSVKGGDSGSARRCIGDKKKRRKRKSEGAKHNSVIVMKKASANSAGRKSYLSSAKGFALNEGPVADSRNQMSQLKGPTRNSGDECCAHVNAVINADSDDKISGWIANVVEIHTGEDEFNYDEVVAYMKQCWLNVERRLREGSPDVTVYSPAKKPHQTSQLPLI